MAGSLQVNVKRTVRLLAHMWWTWGEDFYWHMLSASQYLMNQLWCKLYCITYHQVKSCPVRNAVLGRICARMEQKNRICTTCTTHIWYHSKEGALYWWSSNVFRRPREVPYKKEYAVHGKFLITSLDKRWRRKMHLCTIMPPYCFHLHIHKRETTFFNYTVGA